jgi:hypothetical protein
MKALHECQHVDKNETSETSTPLIIEVAFANEAARLRLDRVVYIGTSPESQESAMIGPPGLRPVTAIHMLHVRRAVPLAFAQTSSHYQIPQHCR